MHFVFIYPSPGVLGGIETLVARMSQWLTRKGHHVTLLVALGGAWTEVLPKEARCITLGDRFKELYYYFHARQLWISLGIEEPDVIKSFDLPSSWMACQLATLLGGRCKVLTGIYNPLVFKWYYSANSLPRWDDNLLYLHNYLKHIPPSAKLFCGTDQIEELVETHQETGVLWPIPIETSQFEPAVRKPKWGKIVSVGRLSPMKEYNLYMIDVVKELRDKGHNVTWTVYGTGEYETTMRERISKAGLEPFILMKGNVPYARFRKVLEDAYIFVGMGTSILEAAMFKVPNVSAGAYDRKGLTCGSVCQYPHGSIGMGLHDEANLKVADEIERILGLSPAEYQTEEDLVGSHVEMHRMDSSMNCFLKLVNETKPINSQKSLYLSNYFLWCLRRVMNNVARSKEIGHPVTASTVKPAGT